MLTKAEQARGFEQQRDLLLNQSDTLKARIAIKEGIILNLNANISDFKSIVKDKDGIIQTRGEERTLLENQIADKNKELKRQRRKTRFVAFVGTAVSGGLLYLFITK